MTTSRTTTKIWRTLEPAPASAHEFAVEIRGAEAGIHVRLAAEATSLLLLLPSSFPAAAPALPGRLSVAVEFVFVAVERRRGTRRPAARSRHRLLWVDNHHGTSL